MNMWLTLKGHKLHATSMLTINTKSDMPQMYRKRLPQNSSRRIAWLHHFAPTPTTHSTPLNNYSTPSVRATNRSSDSNRSYLQPFHHDDWPFLFTSSPPTSNLFFHCNVSLPQGAPLQAGNATCSPNNQNDTSHTHITHCYVRALWGP